MLFPATVKFVTMPIEYGVVNEQEFVASFPVGFVVSVVAVTTQLPAEEKLPPETDSVPT